MPEISGIQRRFLDNQRRRLAEFYPDIAPPTAKTYLENLAPLRADLERQRAQGMDADLVGRKIAELDADKTRAQQLPPEQIELEMLNPYFDRYARFINEIAEAAMALGHDTPVNMIAGTMPTGRIGARLLPVGSEEEATRYVLIDEGLPILANLVAKTVVQCLPLIDDGNPQTVTYDFSRGAVDAHLRTHGAGFAKQYNQILSAYSVDGNVAGAPRQFIDPRWDPLATFWLETIEKFILAHEFAHVLNGKRPKAQEGDALAEWNILRQDEFEADALGFKLLAQDAQRHGLAVSEIVAPVCAFFEMLHDLDFMQIGILKGNVAAAEAGFETYFSTATQDNQPHPEPFERAKAVIGLALDLPNADQRSIAMKCLAVSQITDTFRGLRDILIGSAAKHDVKLHAKFAGKFVVLDP